MHITNHHTKSTAVHPSSRSWMLLERSGSGALPELSLSISSFEVERGAPARIGCLPLEY